MGHGSIDAVVKVEMFAVLYGIAFFVLLGCAFMQMPKAGAPGLSSHAQTQRCVIARD